MSGWGWAGMTGWDQKTIERMNLQDEAWSHPSKGAQNAVKDHVSSHLANALEFADLLCERKQAHLGEMKQSHLGEMKQSPAGWHSNSTHHKQAGASAILYDVNADHSFQSRASAKVM